MPATKPDFINPIRNSRMELHEVYFWTNTIKSWQNLLIDESFKQFIIEQLQWLTERKKIAVYAYVIMPNHMHVLWKMLAMNGKEMPYASFNKWTSSQFLKKLRRQYPEQLPHFIERTSERTHRFWQRDPLAVLMDSREKADQKIDYIHSNPLQEKWNLITQPEDYRWSSAKYYLTGEDEFGVLSHYMDHF